MATPPSTRPKTNHSNRPVSFMAYLRRDVFARTAVHLWLLRSPLLQSRAFQTTKHTKNTKKDRRRTRFTAEIAEYAEKEQWVFFDSSSFVFFVCFVASHFLPLWLAF